MGTIHQRAKMNNVVPFADIITKHQNVRTKTIAPSTTALTATAPPITLATGAAQYT